MIVALIKLPVAVPKKTFDILTKYFEGRDFTPNVRVYKINHELESDIILMGENDVYLDECSLSSDNTFEYGGEKVPAYLVHKRPSEEYVSLEDRYLLVDLEEFYTQLPNLSATIIKTFAVDE